MKEYLAKKVKIDVNKFTIFLKHSDFPLQNLNADV